MHRRPTLSVVIPAFNEEARLEATIRTCVKYLRGTGWAFDLTVIDDGSRDGTSALTRRLIGEFPECRLIRLAANRGKGYAVRTGMVNARGDLVLFADADGATPIEEVDRLAAAIAHGADAAIGSRTRRAPGVQVKARLHRRAIGRVFRSLVSLLTPVGSISDTQCGFKMFRGAVSQDLFTRMRMDGFSFDVEVLMMAIRKGYRVTEVPVNWVHQPGSRVNLAVDSLRMLWDLFVIRARSIRGDYRDPHIAPL